MNEKELKNVCRTHQLPVPGKKRVLISCVVAHLESITDFETKSLECLCLIVKDDAWCVK